jgi:hypothetical protein
LLLNEDEFLYEEYDSKSVSEDENIGNSGHPPDHHQP